MKRHARAQILFTAATLGIVAAANAQGLKPLDPASYTKAIDAGQTRPMADIIGSEMPQMIRAKTDLQGSVLSFPPVSIVVETPYGRIAAAVADNKRTFGTAPPPTMEAANADGVIVKVGLSGNFNTAQKVQSMVIKRGEEIIRPTKSTITPQQIRNGFGATREIATGTFTFDYSAFAGDAPVTFVVVTELRNWEWTMPTNEVRAIQ